MEPLRIRRRDVWRAERRGWRGRLRSSGVLLPLTLGLAMLAGGFPRLTVAYDPEAVRRARRAPPGGLSAAPNPAMLLLGGMGVLLVVVAAYTLLSYSPSSR